MNIYNEGMTSWFCPIETSQGQGTLLSSYYRRVNLTSAPTPIQNSYVTIQNHYYRQTMAMNMGYAQQTQQPRRTNKVQDDGLALLKYLSSYRNSQKNVNSSCINKNRTRLGAVRGTPDPNIPCSTSADDPFCWHCWTSEPFFEYSRNHLLFDYGPIGEGRNFIQSQVQPRSPSPTYECAFCKGNNESEEMTKSHPLRINNVIICPTLRNKTCMICKATGDKAHTIKYCPYNKRGYFADKAKARGELMDKNQRMMAMSEPTRIKPLFFPTSSIFENSHINKSACYMPSYGRLTLPCQEQIFGHPTPQKLPVVRRLQFDIPVNYLGQQEGKLERKRLSLPTKNQKGYIITTGRSSKRGKSMKVTRSSTKRRRTKRK